MADQKDVLTQLFENLGVRDRSNAPWPFCYPYMYFRMGAAFFMVCLINEIIHRYGGPEDLFPIWLFVVWWMIPYLGSISAAVIAYLLAFFLVMTDVIPLSVREQNRPKVTTEEILHPTPSWEQPRQ